MDPKVLRNTVDFASPDHITAFVIFHEDVAWCHQALRFVPHSSAQGSSIQVHGERVLDVKSVWRGGSAQDLHVKRSSQPTSITPDVKMFLL